MHTKLHPNKKNIVVLGAGYCGVQIVKELAKSFQNRRDYQIVLVNSGLMHVCSPDLYEVATAYYPKITNSCMKELADTSYIPLHVIMKNLDVVFLEDNVESIDYESKKVSLKKNGSLDFEYLAVTLGSVTNFYHLPGVEENSFPLKTIQDALDLNCYLEQFFKDRWEKKHHNKVHLVVGGGGFTGVEFACELREFIRKLEGKYGFQENEVDISVVQGRDELIGLGKKISNIALKRFKKLGIRAIFNSRIASYKDKKLELSVKGKNHTEFIPADVLVWTAGVHPNPVLRSFKILNPSGALEVLPTLEAAHYPQVFAGGDNADIFDPEHHSFLPKLAQLAMQEGITIAHNIRAAIETGPQKVYKPHFKGFIIAMGGKYFVYKGFVTFGGILPWMMRRVLDLLYFVGLMPLKMACKKWIKTEEIFMQND